MVSTFANANQPATSTDEVGYAYTVTNNGLLTLYNIAVHAGVLVDVVCVDTNGEEVGGTSLGVVEGLASYPSRGLAPAGSLECSTTSSVSQEEVSGRYLLKNICAEKCWRTGAARGMPKTGFTLGPSDCSSSSQHPFLRRVPRNVR